MNKYLGIIIALVFAVGSFFINKLYENREAEALRNFATQIADETDSEFEDAVTPLINLIKNDSLIQNWYQHQSYPSDDSILSYINSKYFDNTIGDDYTRVLTLCTDDTYLSIEETDIGILCNEFFINILETNSANSANGSLINIDDPTIDTYYIAAIDFSEDTTIYIEFYKERMFDKSQTAEFKNYSFCVYKNDILDYKYGYYLYPNNLNNFISKTDGVHKGYHFKHYISNNQATGKTIVVSIESERWMRLVSLSSFVFFALLLSYYVYLIFQNGRSKLFKKSFHGRIQLTLLLTLALAFFVVGFTSFIFLKNNISQKTQIDQYKQANIIRNRLEINIVKENSLPNPEYLNVFKETFQCDVNIYDLDGNIINTTIIDASQEIDERAYEAIVFENSGYFAQTEYYCDERCDSYYFPILDKNNNLVAIMNIPYFESNYEYDDRFSNFIVTYLGIILLLLGVSSIAVLLITRNTLKPLQLIQEEMSKMNFGVDYPPIEWKSNDEIGALIQQYNKMRWQLENAANKIARNERENAWREMARQVAHEIKNPLTPMRLNIEYLQMLWDRKDPNFEQVLKETMQSLLEQIETLTSIATAYSNYAKLPENNPTTFSIEELLKNTIKLYDVENNISISLSCDENENWNIYADRNNLGRVFGNLIKNAIQAIGNDKDGRIELILNRIGERYKIKISDNGCGIKDEDKAKVFFPNFTTKSSGMGVGLSVSQNIIQGLGGNISFTSNEGKGTVFTIDLPILKEK